jgi:hypothetical protein
MPRWGDYQKKRSSTLGSVVRVSMWIMATVIMVDPLQPNTLLHTLKKMLSTLGLGSGLAFGLGLFLLYVDLFQPNSLLYTMSLQLQLIIGYNVRNGC